MVHNHVFSKTVANRSLYVWKYPVQKKIYNYAGGSVTLYFA